MDTKFQEHKKGSDTHSVWHYYLIANQGHIAKCKKCAKEIKCHGGSTSGLHTHLKTQHKINLKTKSDVAADKDAPCSSDKLPKTLTHYFQSQKKEQLCEILARMVAWDGLPFRVFCSSEDIRKGLQARGYNDLPKSAATIKSMTIEYSKKVKREVITEMSSLKSEGKRFSLTLDEWTSVRNRRYLNVNVHSSGGYIWNIGLARLHGKVPTEKCLEVLKTKLQEFNINLINDIVCMSTDGASVMVKLGHLSGVEHQLCFAHGIHLAVRDVLYKNNSNLEIVDADIEAIGSQSSDCDSEIDDDNDIETDNEENINNIEDGVALELGFVDTKINLNYTNLSTLVAKIRRVIKVFRRSPTKNDEYLQKYVKLQFGKELNLQLDVITRWNSLLVMLERFYQLRHCVQKALIDLNSNIVFSDEEFLLISETINALSPIKLGVEALCRNDSNLLVADATFKFMIDTLVAQKSKISTELTNALRFRIIQRRTDLSQVLQYLHSASSKDQEMYTELFPKLKKSSFTKILIHLINRLGINNNESDSSEDFDHEDEDIPVTASLCAINTLTVSLKQKLESVINKTMTSVPNPKKQNKGLEQQLKKELQFFEEHGIRGTNLNLAYEYLLTIPPTSVESERAFSAAQHIKTKIRSRLDDNTLDNICFLKSYFKLNRK